MGYILPVNHYQYNDYQTRVHRKKQNDKKYVHRSSRVVLEEAHENVRSTYEKYSETSPNSPSTDGKGQYFQARV